jgi:hypothetical protein
VPGLVFRAPYWEYEISWITTPGDLKRDRTIVQRMNEERDRNMPTISARTRLATLLFSGLAAFLFVALPSALGSATSTAATARVLSPVHSPARASDYQPETLPTFVDLPQGATETYPGSGMFKASISQSMAAAIDVQTQENWNKYRIAKESNLGLPLGSLYLKAPNGKYVELAVYERAAFTVFRGKPARQIVSAVLSSGRIQVEMAEFVQLPESTVRAFLKLPIAGEGGAETPSVEAMDRLLTADGAKAVDAGWSMADKMLNADGTLSVPDPKLNITPLTLRQPDATTGHRVPEAMGTGLQKLFGEKLLENAGLPLGPAVWVQARINGAVKPVVVQVFERMIVTYNPSNDENNRVQVGLGGQIVHNGLSTSNAPAGTPPIATIVATSTTAPAATPGTTASVELRNDFGHITISDGETFAFRSRDNAVLTQMFRKIYTETGKTGRVDAHFKFLPNGRDLLNKYKNQEKHNGLRINGLSMARGFLILMTDKNDRNESFIEIPPVTQRGDDNMQILRELYNSPSFADGGKTYVGVEWNKLFLEMYGGIDATQIRPVLGEQLFSHLFASRDSNGMYVYNGNPPLEAIRK